MATPHVSGSFADLLDPRFKKIFYEQYNRAPTMLPEMFKMEPSNGRNDVRWSMVGTLPDWNQFAGTVSYGSSSQGYDTTATPLEFTQGVQIERKLVDDDQYQIMDRRPASMATSLARTREKHGARILNQAFANDTLFYVNSEGVPLCSNSHTTTSGASTASGFDNLTTSALSATALAAARIQFRGIRDDQAELIDVEPDELWIPPDLYEVAFEIVSSMGKVDTAENNRNVHEGRYTIKEWQYLTDANNWFLTDSRLRAESVFWVDRVKPEFAMVEDFDTLVAKWRGYGRWALAQVDWRWIIGAQVA